MQNINSTLKDLHDITSVIHDDIETSRRSDGIIDFNQFEKREAQISNIKYLQDELQEIQSALSQSYTDADDIHQKEISIMREYIENTNSTKKSDKGIPWKDKELTARVVGCSARKNNKEITNISHNDMEFSYENVILNDNISLEAIIIPETIEHQNILSYVNTTDLYYIPAWNHFAVKCGSVIFHGNIGDVYSTDRSRPFKTPEKVKECRYQNQCLSLRNNNYTECSYYHDPEECPGSHDTRNFIADSWIYTSSTSRYSSRYGSRKLSSRDSLGIDIQRITTDDAKLHISQTTHDILCSIILTKYIIGQN